MDSKKNLIDNARKFAELMDSNKYVEVGQFLASKCSYKFRGNEILGRDAILKTYIDNYESASKKLDEIQFSSEVIPLGKSKFKLKYLDRIRKGELQHEHRCEQLWNSPKKVDSFL